MLDSSFLNKFWSSRLPLLGGLVAAVFVGCVFLFSNNKISDPKLEPKNDEQIVQLPMLSEEEGLNKAFYSVFGAAGSAIVDLKGESVTFTPKRFLDVDGQKVLISSGEVIGAAHSSGGKVAIHYGSFQGDTFTVTKSFVPFTEIGSWGVFSEIGVSSAIAINPVLYVEGGGTWQGYSCSWTTLIEIAPNSPIELATILTATSDAGAVGEEDGKSYEGKISNVIQGTSFDVLYSGSSDISKTYIRSVDGTYVLKSPQVPLEGC